MIQVLGAGLAGLITAFYTGGVAIGATIGGQMKKSNAGPRILERTPETTDLLDRLGIKARPYTFKVGYLCDGAIVPECSLDDRVNYYRKTRLFPHEINRAVPESVMSGNKRSITGWDMEKIDLLEALKARTNIQIGIIESIPDGPVISTIGLPVLLHMLPYDLLTLTGLDGVDRMGVVRDDLNLSSETTHFLSVESLPPIIGDLGKYSYVYIPDPTIPFHRVTKTPTGYTIEVRETRVAQAMFMLDRLDIEYETFSIKGAQISKSLDLDKICGTPLIGRYAQWSHGVKTEDVIRRASLYAKQMGD